MPTNLSENKEWDKIFEAGFKVGHSYDLLNMAKITKLRNKIVHRNAERERDKEKIKQDSRKF